MDMDAFENTLLVRYSSQQGGLQWIVKHWLRDMCCKWFGPHTLSNWLADQDCRDLISNQPPLKTKGPSFYSAFLPHPPTHGFVAAPLPIQGGLPDACDASAPFLCGS